MRELEVQIRNPAEKVTPVHFDTYVLQSSDRLQVNP